jgi:galactonate dehydratase
MKIIGIEPVVIHVTQRGDWVFLLVHTDAGLVGLGEASHSGNDALLVSTVNVFEQSLIGESPFNIASIWQRLARLNGGRVAHTALSGIEQALWDIVGQRLGVPIHTFFGGAVRDRLRLYANINRHVRDRSPHGFARAASQAVDEGFTAIKLAPFDELGEPHHVRTGPAAAWRAGVARVEAVRAAVGPEIDLAVDCHGRMEPAEAIIVGRALAECRLLWYEEPVPHVHTDQLARVSREVPMPTASAESVFALEGFRPFLTQSIVDVIMPDVKHAGGLLETLKIASAARMSQLLVAPHNPSGPVATVATAHVCSTIRNFLILEYAWGEVDWRASLLRPAEPIQDGYLHLSTAPGLGYQLNPEVLHGHRQTIARATDSTKVTPEPNG